MPVPQQAVPQQACLRAGCGATALLLPDDLSYALGHSVWICTAGHRLPDVRAAQAPGEAPGEALGPVPRIDGLHRAVPVVAEAIAAGLSAPDLLRISVRTARGRSAQGVAALLVDGRGRASVGAAASGAASGDDADLLELTRLAALDGPALASVLAGATVTVGDVELLGGHWSAFSARARLRGLHAVHVAPMRLRDQLVGVLVLLSTTPHAFGPDERAAARALADLNAVGVLLSQPSADTGSLSQRMRQALEERVRIERAVGVLAEREAVDVAEARERLRARARRAGTSMQDAAHEVLDHQQRAEAR